MPDSLTRLFSSMFVHANIAHIAFNLFALTYLGVYAERAIGVPRYILVYLHIRNCSRSISWCCCFLHFTQWKCSIDRCVRSNFWCIRDELPVTGNTRAYYWLALQIVFAVIGSISALPIAFTAHVGGFIAGVAMTKVFGKIRKVKKKITIFPETLREKIVVEGLDD